MLYPLLILSLLATDDLASRGIPPTPVMTPYQFNGELAVPTYNLRSFLRHGPTRPSGKLTQGTALIPCLVMRQGRPLTDRSGTPYVGFSVALDPKKATHLGVERLKTLRQERKGQRVPNHHCEGEVQQVVSVRRLIARESVPHLEPPVLQSMPRNSQSSSTLDAIVRAFHNSQQCIEANRSVLRRRESLQRAWGEFIENNLETWPRQLLERAKGLDYTMRTSIYEGHMDRGCTAYGALRAQHHRPLHSQSGSGSMPQPSGMSL